VLLALPQRLPPRSGAGERAGGAGKACALLVYARPHQYKTACLGDTAKPELRYQRLSFTKMLWNPSLLILYVALKCWYFKSGYRYDSPKIIT